MHPLPGMAEIKERPFKTAPYPLRYLAENIYRFYNGLSPQHKIKGKNIINDHGPIK